jgi:hypothetical protein
MSPLAVFVTHFWRMIHWIVRDLTPRTLNDFQSTIIDRRETIEKRLASSLVEETRWTCRIMVRLTFHWLPMQMLPGNGQRQPQIV